MKIKDQLHRTITLNQIPKRIVSLVPSQTELLVDLGLEDSLVGITRFCIHPKHLRKTKTIVGGTKHVNIAKVEALQPDIILCNKEENTIEIVTQLEAIAPVHVSDISTVKDTLDVIDAYGALFNCKEQAANIHEQIRNKERDFKVFVANKKPLKVAYFIWKNPWMVAAKDTFINSVLHLNGFENVFQDSLRYPEITLEDKGLEQAEVFLLSSEPFPFKEAHIETLRILYPQTKIVLVDGEFFSWYGSRLILAFNYFKALRTRLK